MTLLLFKKPSFLSRTSSSLFRRKTNSKKIWPNFLEKCFFEYPKMTFFKSRKTSFLSGTSSNIISRPFFLKEKQLKKKFPIFGQNHGLTPFEKWTFPTVLKWHVSCLESLFSPKERYWTSCLGPFPRNWDSEEISSFWRKSWVNPFREMDIFQLWWNDIFCLQQLYLLCGLVWLNWLSRLHSVDCANGVKCTNWAGCLHRLYCLYRLETAWIVRSKPIALTVSIVLIVLITLTILIVLTIRTLGTYLLCWLYRLYTAWIVQSTLIALTFFIVLTMQSALNSPNVLYRMLCAEHHDI